MYYIHTHTWACPFGARSSGRPTHVENHTPTYPWMLPPFIGQKERGGDLAAPSNKEPAYAKS